MKNRVYSCSVCTDIDPCIVDFGRVMIKPETCASGDKKPDWQEMSSQEIKKWASELVAQNGES
jgi:hypothetical protein